MATAYKRGSTWWIAFKGATGKRTVQATKAATKSEARRIAEELERRAERQRLGLEMMPTDSKMTLWELCEWWLDERCPKASLFQARHRLDRHIRRTELGSLPLLQVTPARVETYFIGLERKGRAGSTINKLRGWLRVVFSKAIKAEKWSGLNPIERVERRKEHRTIRPTLQADELPRLLREIPDSLKALFVTALFTGMRRGELFALRKQDVNLREGTITVCRSGDRNTTKGGHADVIPIAPVLTPFLQHAIDSSKSDCELVFPDEDGEMRTAKSDPRRVLRAALGRAGIVEGYDYVCRRCKSKKAETHTWRHADRSEERRCPNCAMRLWPKPIPKPLRFHDLRHSTATLLLQAGVDAHRVQRILRHRDVRITTAIYGHLLVDDLRDAVAKLPSAPLQLPPAPPRATNELQVPITGSRNINAPPQLCVATGRFWRSQRESNPCFSLERATS